MKHYKFIEIDEDANTTTSIEFSTESDCWSSESGVLYQFFKFMKGCGWLFNATDQLGVMQDGEFIGSTEMDM